ncbi:cyclic nucleotide-binding domain-containing protein [Actinomadura sp. KC345]|uniref:cyclic nucleotide-binding domain-containing protein n=1 Tax=Actinomadura sp. KC345 TaxID=2530371 RepID=UPI0010430D43|nr:cyclic nucleotide-binding domain-containing protein [Actinomadura sp. KC345]TDC44391.1 cyclic nucleotide-binding domain-containing protein [Actinomadura sp. KC345]
MDEYTTRQHDPDHVAAPSEIVPSGGGRPPRTRAVPESECRDVECPRRLRSVRADRFTAPPPRQGFWGSLTDVEQAALLATAQEVAYPVGTVLWFEGQAADQAVVIRSGSIRVSVERDGHERIIAFRGPGDIIGERAALLLRRRSATIVAMDTVHGLRMTTQQFVTYLSDHPRVVAVMEREVYDRLTEQTGPLPQTPPTHAHNAPYEPQSPHTGSAQPYLTHAPPYAVSAQDYATTTRPDATPAPPHLTSTQPYAIPVQPNTTSTRAYAAPTQRYYGTSQPYPTSGQVYAAGPAPLGYPQAGPPDPAAAGGSAYTVRTPGGADWPVHQGTGAGVPPDAQLTQPMATPVGPAWTGQNCTIVYTDIVGFSAPHRNDVDRLEMRRAMYAVLREAFEESRIPWAACHTEDRGDGALIVVPPGVPTAAVIDPMIAALAVRLRRHNQRSSGAVHFQLRVAVDVGPVMPDPPGVTGFALIRTARLLDARPLKERLAATGADLGFIASQFVFETVIAHGAGYVHPAEYEPISCRVKKLKTEGWIHLRGVPAQSAV